EAQAYLDNLLNNGSQEGDSGSELELPSWYDEQLFKRGQAYFSKYRFVMTSGMLAGLIAVLAVPSILRVLVCTRQSSNSFTAYRRYVRTTFHTHAWYYYSIEDRSSKFWTSIAAVRKAHSRSSHVSGRRGAGQITQKDLALTQFGFIGFITVGAHRIQLYDPDFLEATCHMWRVIGYLLGIKDEYNICGRNWAESRPRLEIVMHKVYKPALSSTTDEFYRMTEALIHGLWHVNTMLSVKANIFFTKRLAYVKGYEYFSFDHLVGEERDPKQKSCYYDLGFWDRFIVSYGLFIVTYLHKYAFVRWYFNFRVWLMDLFTYYLPYVAIWKFGIKWAYVSIFKSGGKALELELTKDD
ncbi:CG31344, partial [Drosophila busckii]